MNEDLLTCFVDELYRQRIPIWILRDIRGDYMHRVDRDQVANDVAYAIYTFLSMQPEFNPQLIHNTYGLCRRISRCIAIDAIKHVSRHKRALWRSRNFHIGEPETLVDGASTSGSFMVDYDDFCQFHLNAMTREQRVIAKLRIDGWTNVEISERIGCSPKRIQGKLSKINVFIRERLKQEAGSRRKKKEEEGGRIRRGFELLAMRNSRFIFRKNFVFRRSRKVFVDLSNSGRKTHGCNED